MDEAEKQGENGTFRSHRRFARREVLTKFNAAAQEIATLRKEAQAFKVVRSLLRTPEGSDAAKRAFEKVFHSDILNLLSMADMWKARAPPTPLEFDAIQAGTFKLKKDTNQSNGTSDQNGTAKNGSTPVASGSAATEKILNGSQAATTSKSGLKDQRELSLQDSLELFVARYELHEISFALFELNLSIAPAD